MFYGFTNPVNIVASGSGSTGWFTVDVSSYVPAGATGVALYAVDTIGGYAASARPTGSSFNVAYRIGISGKSYLYAKLNANSQFDFYRNNTSIAVYLVGYFYENDNFLSNLVNKTPSTSESWQTVTCSEVPDGTKAVVFLYINSYYSDLAGGIRPVGSTIGTQYMAAYYGNFVVVTLNSSKQVEIYTQNSTYLKFYLGGYLKDGTFYSTPENYNKAPSTIGSWQNVTISEMDSGGAAFLHMYGGSISYGLRRPGSSDTNTSNFNAQGSYNTGVCGTDTSKVVQIYRESTSFLNMYLMGWTQSLPVTPQNLSATSVSDSQINLAWDVIAAEYSSVEVHEGTLETNTSLLQTLSSGATSYSRTGLSERVARFYKVRGVNEYGNGPFSSVVLGKTKALLKIQDAQGGPGVIDANNQPISGAKVFVKDAFTQELLAVLTTDASGKAQTAIASWPRMLVIDFDPGRSNKTITVFSDNFTSLSSNWVKLGGGGTASIVSDANASDGYALEASGYVWYEHSQNIAVDPNALYRIRAKIRQVQDPTSGGKNIYVGVSGVASDGTTRVTVHGQNSWANQHYFAAFADTLAVGSTYTEFVGYFWGFGTPAGGKKPSRTAPGLLYPQIAYIRPVFVLNYDGGNGIARIDYVIIEKVSSDEAKTTSKNHIIL
jgi:hypothetical protein